MTSSSPQVSILMPTRNRLAWFREALATARSQTHSPLEILVSDDGSSDGTPEWAREIAKEDPRVRLLPPNPRPGLFENLNHLASHARGDALFFLADDDRLLPEGLEHLVGALDAHPECGAATGEYWVLDAAGHRQAGATAQRIAQGGRGSLAAGCWHEALRAALATDLNLGAALFRKAALDVFRFDTSCGGAADVELWIRVSQRAPVAYVPQKVSEVRMHPGQALARPDYMALGVIRAMQLHPQSDPALERERLRVLQRYRVGVAARRATTHRWEALRYVGDYLKDSRGFWEPRALASLGVTVVLSALPYAVGAPARRYISALTGRQYPATTER